VLSYVHLKTGSSGTYFILCSYLTQNVNCRVENWRKCADQRRHAGVDRNFTLIKCSITVSGNSRICIVVICILL
jgi:hypothetical protein